MIRASRSCTVWHYALMLLAVMASFVILSDAGHAQPAERRTALIIANSRYAALPHLEIAGHTDLAAALRQNGYDVIVLENVNRRQFEGTVRQFFRNVNAANTAVFAFGGHVVHVAGRNYLIPVDAKLDDPHSLEFEAFSLEAIVDYTSARTVARLIAVDAGPSGLEGRSFVALDMSAAVEPGLADIPVREGGLVVSSVPLRGASAAALPLFRILAQSAAEPGQTLQDLRARLDDERQRTGSESLIRVGDVRGSVVAFSAPREAPRPQAEHVVALTNDGSAQPISFPAPVAVSGGAIRVVFQDVPRGGDLALDGRRLDAGDSVTLDDAHRLQFSPNASFAGSRETISYRIVDSFGSSGVGRLVLSARTTNASATPPVETAASLARSFVESNHQRRVSISVGVGPRPLDLTVPAAREASTDDPFGVSRLEIVNVPQVGRLLFGSRVLGLGATLPLIAASQLSFEPSAGSEGAVLPVSFRIASQGRDVVAQVEIAVALTDCDRLAGDRLDRQGMSAGVLPNEINAADAVEACRGALNRYGEIARFRFQLARALLANRQQYEAFRELERAADMGHSRSLYYLGHLNELGARGAIDQRVAADFYRRSSETGDPFGIYAYGRALYHGRGVPQDRRQGLTLMLSAAEAGHTFAMNELGAIFLRGNGLPQDTERARRFFEAGVARDDIYSMNNLGLVYVEGAGVPQDYLRARALFQQATDGGHPGAPNNLGRIYLNGWGLAADRAEALRLFEIAAQRGDVAGAFNVGDILLTDARAAAQRARAVRFLAFAASAQNTPRSGLPARAEQRLNSEDRAARERALRDVIRDLDPAYVLPNPINSAALRRVATAFRNRAIMPESPDVNTALIALSRASWLASRPRLDLF